jgi:hypothetical protein
MKKFILSEKTLRGRRYAILMRHLYMMGVAMESSKEMQNDISKR